MNEIIMKINNVLWIIDSIIMTVYVSDNMKNENNNNEWIMWMTNGEMK